MRLPAGLLELADIDLLLSVQRLGSLGKAAREHQLSQPAVSARIRVMERRLGLRLLARSPSGSQLTSAGSTVASCGQAVVDAAVELYARTAALRDAEDGWLRVAAGLTAGDYLLPGWLAALRDLQSEVAVELRVENSHGAAQRVRDGQVDLGVVDDPCSYESLAERVIGRDELCVVVAPSHPWARHDHPLTADELSGGVLVVRERGSGTRETLDRALGGLRGRSRHLELGSTTAVKEAVLSGVGAAAVSRLAVRNELHAGDLVAVPVTGLDLSRQLRAVWRREVGLSRAATLLLELATTHRVGMCGRRRHLRPVHSIECAEPERCPCVRGRERQHA